jgi:hypothetical protein
MTLSEYFASRQEKKLPNHSVELAKDEFYKAGSIPLTMGDRLFTIVIPAFNWNYVCCRDGLLWTSDEDGNKKSRSVFKINPNLL